MSSQEQFIFIHIFLSYNANHGISGTTCHHSFIHFSAYIFSINSPPCVNSPVSTWGFECKRSLRESWDLLLLLLLDPPLPSWNVLSLLLWPSPLLNASWALILISEIQLYLTQQCFLIDFLRNLISCATINAMEEDCLTILMLLLLEASFFLPISLNFSLQIIELRFVSCSIFVSFSFCCWY